MNAVEQARAGKTLPAIRADWRGICTIGGIAVGLQLILSLVTLTVVLTLGGEPASPAEYFAVLGDRSLDGLLRLDFASLVNIPLYYLTFLALYAAFRETDREAYACLAVILACAGVTLWIGSHSGLSMIHLSREFGSAASEAEKAALIAAGRAVIASDMWHGSGAFLSGILLEGGALLVSVIMIGGRLFRLGTAWVGIVTHGLDLLHVVIMPFAAGPAVLLMMVAGPLYLLWFLLLGQDLIRLGRRSAGSTDSRQIA